MYEDTLLQKIWRIIYPVLIYFFVTLFVQFVAEIIISTDYFYGLSDYPGEAGSDVMYNFMDDLSEVLSGNTIYISIFTLIITFIIIKKIYDKDKHLRSECYNINHNINIVAIIGLAVVMSTGFSRLISLFFSASNSNYEDIEDSLLDGNIVAVIIGVGILAPLVEELIFRGLIYNRLKQYTPPYYATFLSAAMFGIYHFNLVQGLYACFLGLALVFVYEKYKTLWAPIIFHASANNLSIMLTKTGISDFLSKNIFVYILLMILEIGLTIVLFRYINKSVVNIDKKSDSVVGETIGEAVEDVEKIFDEKV